MAFSSLLFSWIVGLCSAFFAVLLTIIGQGIGASVGGCRWIGLTLALDHQPWALINQPNLAFSGRPIALGYWFGGVGFCLLLALLTVPFLPRPRNMGWELLCLHISWMSLLVGLAWLPLLDAWDGHVSHYLRLHGSSPAWVWVFPILGAWIALIPTYRLLALLRAADRTASGFKRAFCIMAHFGVPSIAWVIFGLALQLPLLQAAASADSMPGMEILVREFWPPVLGALLPVLAAALMALTAYPRPYSFPMTPLRGIHVPVALFMLLLFCGIFLLAGAPVGDGHSRGLLWATPNSRNNIRSWVRPSQLWGEAPGLPNTN